VPSRIVVHPINRIDELLPLDLAAEPVEDSSRRMTLPFFVKAAESPSYTFLWTTIVTVTLSTIISATQELISLVPGC
jgi:hypothetical protein